MDKLDNQEEGFRTSDIKFAAFLKAAKVPFLDVVDDGTRKVFVFETGAGIRDLRKQYFSRQPDTLASLTLFDEFDALKILTHMD